MADRNQADFYDRVDRISRNHGRGHGFEADGTLGRSYYMRNTRRGIPILGPLLMVLLCGLLLKAALYQQVGAATYQQRLEGLRQGDTLDRAGAFVMQPDVVTRRLAEGLDRLIAALR